MIAGAKATRSGATGSTRSCSGFDGGWDRYRGAVDPLVRAGGSGSGCYPRTDARTERSALGARSHRTAAGHDPCRAARCRVRGARSSVRSWRPRSGCSHPRVSDAPPSAGVLVALMSLPGLALPRGWLDAGGPGLSCVGSQCRCRVGGRGAGLFGSVVDVRGLDRGRLVDGSRGGGRRGGSGAAGRRDRRGADLAARGRGLCGVAVAGAPVRSVLVSRSGPRGASGRSAEPPWTSQRPRTFRGPESGRFHSREQ